MLSIKLTRYLRLFLPKYIAAWKFSIAFTRHHNNDEKKPLWASFEIISILVFLLTPFYTVTQRPSDV